MLTASGPGGVNEIQYAAFLMMIARHTGYKPGIFSHVVANEQIYDRHMDAAEEMKTRYTQRCLAEEAA
jgi:thymidylate synthase